MLRAQTRRVPGRAPTAYAASVTEGVEDPKLSAEGELAMTSLALDDDEYANAANHLAGAVGYAPDLPEVHETLAEFVRRDRKSTRLNSSHVKISYAVFCLKKKKEE